MLAKRTRLLKPSASMPKPRSRHWVPEIRPQRKIGTTSSPVVPLPPWHPNSRRETPRPDLKDARLSSDHVMLSDGSTTAPAGPERERSPSPSLPRSRDLSPCNTPPRSSAKPHLPNTSTGDKSHSDLATPNSGLMTAPAGLEWPVGRVSSLVLLSFSLCSNRKKCQIHIFLLIASQNFHKTI